MSESTLGNISDYGILDVESLHFDPSNPRLPNRDSEGNELNKNNERAVIKWMLENASIIELMGSIAEKGYFPGEPLLVVKKPNSELEAADYYYVIEGNRRLCAVKLLLNPELAETRKLAVKEISDSVNESEKLKKLPVIKYSQRSDILAYLGFRHITGIKEWSSLAKARYLRDLDEEAAKTESDHKERYKTLARTIGSRPDYVALLLTALSLYERIENNHFFGLRSLNESKIDFSLLTTALGYKNIASVFLGLESPRNPLLLGLKESHLRELTEWMFVERDGGRTVLGESRNLTKLNRVLDQGQERALEVLRKKGDLDEAEELTGSKSKLFIDYLSVARHNLEDAQSNVHRVEDSDQDVAEVLLKEIEALTRNITVLIQLAKSSRLKG